MLAFPLCAKHRHSLYRRWSEHKWRHNIWPCEWRTRVKFADDNGEWITRDVCLYVEWRIPSTNLGASPCCCLMWFDLISWASGMRAFYIHTYRVEWWRVSGAKAAARCEHAAKICSFACMRLTPFIFHFINHTYGECERQWMFGIWT